MQITTFKYIYRRGAAEYYPPLIKLVIALIRTRTVRAHVLRTLTDVTTHTHTDSLQAGENEKRA